MIRRGRSFAPSVFLLALFLAWASAANAALPVKIVGGTSDEVVISAEDIARHKASGVVFPKRIGELAQSRVTVFGPGDTRLNVMAAVIRRDSRWPGAEAGR